VDGH